MSCRAAPPQLADMLIGARCINDVASDWPRSRRSFWQDALELSSRNSPSSERAQRPSHAAIALAPSAFPAAYDSPNQFAVSIRATNKADAGLFQL